MPSTIARACRRTARVAGRAVELDAADRPRRPADEPVVRLHRRVGVADPRARGERVDGQLQLVAARRPSPGSSASNPYGCPSCSRTRPGGRRRRPRRPGRSRRGSAPSGRRRASASSVPKPKRARSRPYAGRTRPAVGVVVGRGTRRARRGSPAASRSQRSGAPGLDPRSARRTRSPHSSSAMACRRSRHLGRPPHLGDEPVEHRVHERAAVDRARARAMSSGCSRSVSIRARTRRSRRAGSAAHCSRRVGDTTSGEVGDLAQAGSRRARLPSKRVNSALRAAAISAARRDVVVAGRVQRASPASTAAQVVLVLGRRELDPRQAVAERRHRGAPVGAHVARSTRAPRQRFDRVEQEPRGHVLGAAPQVAAGKQEHAIAGRRRRAPPAGAGGRLAVRSARSGSSPSRRRARGRSAADRRRPVRTGTRPRRARTRRAGRGRRRARSRRNRRGRPHRGARPARGRRRARAPAFAGTRRATVRASTASSPASRSSAASTRRAASCSKAGHVARLRSSPIQRREPAGGPIPPSPTTTSVDGGSRHQVAANVVDERASSARRARGARSLPRPVLVGRRSPRNTRRAADATGRGRRPPARPRRPAPIAPGSGRPLPSRNGAAASSAKSVVAPETVVGQREQPEQRSPEHRVVERAHRNAVVRDSGELELLVHEARVRVLAGEQHCHPFERHTVPHRVDDPARSRASRRRDLTS